MGFWVIAGSANAGTPESFNIFVPTAFNVMAATACLSTISSVGGGGGPFSAKAYVQDPPPVALAAPLDPIDLATAPSLVYHSHLVHEPLIETECKLSYKQQPAIHWSFLMSNVSRS